MNPFVLIPVVCFVVLIASIAGANSRHAAVRAAANVNVARAMTEAGHSMMSAGLRLSLIAFVIIVLAILVHA